MAPLLNEVLKLDLRTKEGRLAGFPDLKFFLCPVPLKLKQQKSFPVKNFVHGPEQQK